MSGESQPLQKSAAGDHGETQGCSTGGLVTFVLGLISGTFSALLCKMAYDTSSIGIDGVEKDFAKPIMMLFLMFAGMVPAIFFWLIQQSFLPPDQRDKVSYQTMGVLIIPSLCDLLCTLLLLVAQLYITASLWQMMRGSIIIITALLKRFVLSHNLKLHMWLGVTVITTAMLLVASTSFFSPEVSNPSAKDPRVGIMLVVLGCLAQGVQYVFEEKVMAVDNAPPLVVIGCEGIWGTVLTVLLVYPLAYIMPGEDNGSFEDPFDAFAMMQNSSTLSSLAICFVITVTMYNCAAVYVTKYLSSIWHAILDNFRPITIWGLDLALFYFILPGSGFGEEWIAASWLQFAGLGILLFGTAIYNGSVITFHDMEYAELTSEEKEEVELTAVIKTEYTMASPSITRSPLIYPSNQNQRQQQLQQGYNSTGTAVRRGSEV